MSADPHEIVTLDLLFQGIEGVIATYLIPGPEPILVDPGPSTTRPGLVASLLERGLKPEDVRHVFLTHIHLDHAGCAGFWGELGATVYVHHRGAPHMIDPSRLIRSATRIYGDSMKSLWGDIPAVPSERVVPLTDGATVEISGLEFRALDTPGHASHHHVFRCGDIAFTGDAAGIRVNDGQWLDLPSPPPEFDLQTWERTCERMEAESFHTLYPTHFGPITDPSTHWKAFSTMMRESAVFVRDAYREGASEEALRELYSQWQIRCAAQRGIEPSVVEHYQAANPVFMTISGIIRYWDRQEPRLENDSSTR